MKTLPRYMTLILPAVTVVSISLSCGSGDQATPGDSAADATVSESPESGTAAATAATATTAGYRVVDVTSGGTIRGVVRFAGSVPAPGVVEVDEDSEACGSTQTIQLITIGPSDGLADVVASLTDIEEGAALVAPGERLELDQSGCRFVPHVVMVPVGVPLAILNSDPITHNLHTLGFDNRSVNRAQPSAVREVEISFRAPEKVKLNCDIHSWMGAWIVVMGHPYYGKTGLDGNFTIDNVPAGTYTLELWHETLGTQTMQVTVVAGETTEVALELSPQT